MSVDVHPIEGDPIFDEDGEVCWMARHLDRPRNADRWAAIEAWRFDACKFGSTPRCLARWARAVNRDETLAEKGFSSLESRHHNLGVGDDLTSEEWDALSDAWPWEWDDGFVECKQSDSGAFPVWRIEKS